MKRQCFFMLEKFFYIFLRYSPPTSYNACDIDPSEHTLAASINASKVFLRSRATRCNFLSKGLACV